MHIVFLNLCIVAGVMVYLDSQFRLARHLPEKEPLRFIVQFVGIVMTWILIGFMSSLYPDSWKGTTDASEPCYDKQGAYACEE